MGGTGSVVWESDDRLLVDGTPYVLMNERRTADELRIFKPRLMVEGYDPIIEENRGANIVELGIYSGGSTAYFAQRCRPRRLVALDRSPERVPELDRFLDEHELTERVALHYGVDQADRAALRAIVDEDLRGEALDLVIDDASHEYHPTVASFEELFPRLRPGGLYVIEDWTSDEWLVRSFAGAIESTDRMGRAIIEAWVAQAIRQGNVVSAVFERWAVSSLLDARTPHHESVTRWFQELDRPGASEDATTIIDRIRACSVGDLLEVDAPTLGTLGLQLVLAVKGLCTSISSVALTPFTIAVRRGGAIADEPFTVGSLAVDHVGVLPSLGRQSGESMRSTPPMMSG
jgi:SAM-dependent methyltransferase